MTLNRIIISFAMAVAATLVAASGQAAVIGSTVVGNLTFGVSPSNYFSPTTGFVPAGYSNATSNAVVLGDPAKDFGFSDGSNLDTADFTSNQLYVSDTVFSSSPYPWVMTFTAAAGVFSNLSLVTSNFVDGLTYGVIGNTMVISYAGGDPVGYHLAVFNLNVPTVTAVPEPETLALMLGGLGVVGFVAARRRG